MITNIFSWSLRSTRNESFVQTRFPFLVNISYAATTAIQGKSTCLPTPVFLIFGSASLHPYRYLTALRRLFFHAFTRYLFTLFQPFSRSSTLLHAFTTPPPTPTVPCSSFLPTAHVLFLRRYVVMSLLRLTPFFSSCSRTFANVRNNSHCLRGEGGCLSVLNRELLLPNLRHLIFWK